MWRQGSQVSMCVARGSAWKWQPTPVFLPGEFYGQRSQAGYSPWGRKESGMTERLSTVVRVLVETRLLRPWDFPGG